MVSRSADVNEMTLTMNFIVTDSKDPFGVIGKNNLFMASGLRKYYEDLLAVRDVSFRVGQGECFGLLGVNGAGKSTIFKMLTGEVNPNAGTMYLKGKATSTNYKQVRSSKVLRSSVTLLLSRTFQYLSQLGYCPQTDALIDNLNSLEHLYLFARIRGIPEDRIESEVNKWIDRLSE